MKKALVLGAALACTPIASGLDDVIAIEVRSPSSIQMLVGDTLTLVAAGITAAGEDAEGVEILWAILDVDSGQVGFTLDTLTGFVQGQQAGNGRVQARIENLRSEALTITVTDTTSPGAS